jgi:hypothetical protein
VNVQPPRRDPWTRGCVVDARIAACDLDYHHHVTMNLLRGLQAGLVAGAGLDDEAASCLALELIERWGRGQGNVHPRVRRLAREALALRSAPKPKPRVVPTVASVPAMPPTVSVREALSTRPKPKPVPTVSGPPPKWVRR